MNKFVYAGNCRSLFPMDERIIDEIGNNFHFLLFHTARCYCRSTDTDTACNKRGLIIERNCIFIHRYACNVKNFLRFFSCNVFGTAGSSASDDCRFHLKQSNNRVDEEQMRAFLHFL